MAITTIEGALDEIGVVLSAEIAPPARAALARGDRFEAVITILENGQGYVVTMRSQASSARKGHRRYIRLQ